MRCRLDPSRHILLKSIRAGERVLKSITHYLATKLKLLVNEEKSQVVQVGQSKFLGFTFNRGKIQWHAKTLHIFKQKMRRLTNRNWGVSMGYQLFKVRHRSLNKRARLDPLLWHSECLPRLCRQWFEKRDHWIRCRVRM